MTFSPGIHVRRKQGRHTGLPLQFRNLLFDKIDHLGFDLYPIQTIDPWDSAGTQTIDFYHLITNNVNPYEKQALFSQTVPDHLANGAVLVCNVVLIGPRTRVNIRPKIPFARLSPHGTHNFTV